MKDPRPAIAILATCLCTSANGNGASLPPSEQAAADRCVAIAKTVIDQGQITRATYVRTGPYMGGVKIPRVPALPIPAHCRIEIVLKPSPDSEIKEEVWLPATGWNGRFLGVGNGGFAGLLNTQEVAIAVQRGYAAMTTDTGHVDSPTEKWAAGHPERIVDYAYRAMHLATLTGKALTRQFYDRRVNKSYFSACSNGGRQGLMEASRFPEDYDGIIAGAPAADMSGLFTSGLGWTAKVMRQYPVPKVKNAAIAAAVLKQCDKIDGFADGVLDDPRACRFDPAVLACHGAETDNCLTQTQLKGLRAIYAGPTDATGRPVYPALSVGGEVAEPPSLGWDFWVLGSRDDPANAQAFTTGFMRDMITHDATWTIDRLDPVRDYARVRMAGGRLFNADLPDLSAFSRRGGKLILYHGWADSAIPPMATIRYYNALRARMGTTRVAGFARLYMIPGMQHCWFGPGAWSFNPVAARTGGDPNNDMAAKLERWVELGKAPGALVAVRPTSPESVITGLYDVKISRSSLLCPYPAASNYVGKGDRLSAASYACNVRSKRR